jgi:hypothetical protein
VKYTFTGSALTFATQNGNMSLCASLNGDQLLLTNSAGQSDTYQRKGTGSATGAANTATTPASGTGGMELVGQWCYMSNTSTYGFNDCYTLNANGTWSSTTDNSITSNDYSSGTAHSGSNSGTWSYNGTYLHMTSSQGSADYPLQKTYNKNGDPCIVVNGKTYFSATQHARW